MRCSRRSAALHGLALLGLCLPGAALEPTQCAHSLDGLGRVAGDSSFPLRWEETSMTDGRPLVVSILEKDGSLFLEFVKTREGLWAEGAAVICEAGSGLEARLADLRMGPAAHWLLRRSFGNGRTFTLSRQPGGQLRIATPGWKGSFRAQE